MLSIRRVLIAILVLSTIVFCALFGSLPRLRKTPIGYINRFIWITLPGTLLSIDQLLTRGRTTVALKRAGWYLMWENHPLVLMFYLTILFGAQSLFIYSSWPRLSFRQRILSTILILLPYILTYLTVTSTSSIITPSNHATAMRQYPYDYILFYPGQICPTCRLPKPARSKHCRLCNTCTAKNDHHCLWVMNCIARDNYVWFLSMVASLGTMLSYGAYLSYGMLSAGLARRYVPWPVNLTMWTRMDMYFEAIALDPGVGCTGLLATFTAPLAWGLLAYHIYLIYLGMTTSESFKWDEWREDVNDGYVYIRAASSPRSRTIPRLRMTKHDHLDDITADSWKSLKRFEFDELNPYVPWPARSKTVVINTVNRASSDQEPNADLAREPWTRMKNLGEATNLYDLGFMENLWDVVRWMRGA